MLAEETPASFVAFDLLALATATCARSRSASGAGLLEWHPQRQAAAGSRHADHRRSRRGRGLVPALRGRGFDGVMAKPSDGPYVEDVRAMWKVKHQRTADCVVAGFRWHKDGEGVGSMLLGLYDDRGELNHVGVAASFAAKLRRELVDELAPYKAVDLTDHPWRSWAEAEAHDGTRLMPGTPSRWTGKKDQSWVPLRPERVVEVRFENLQAAGSGGQPLRPLA
jgi:ATP-dependent DNA ligase